jgi:dUTP pyrophosphatase
MAKEYLLVDYQGNEPQKQHETDAGFDLIAEECIRETWSTKWFKTGTKIDIPEGYVGLVFPRSSITTMNMRLGNGVGVIDSGFRGDIQFRFDKKFFGMMGDTYEVGDRIGQLLILQIENVDMREVEEFVDESSRMENGFGSTGK